MPEIKSVIIIGAGISGPALAILLSRLSSPPTSITIYESSPAPRTIGGAINLTPNALRILSSLSVAPQILSSGASTTTLSFLSGHSAKSLGVVPFGSREKHGYSSLRVPRRDINTALIAQAESEGVRIVYNAKLIGIRECHSSTSAPKVVAEFEDGTSSDEADLLVGCDGIHSAVRRSYVDPGKIPHYTGISNAYGIVSKEVLSKDLELLNMQDEDMMMVTTRKGSMIVCNCDEDREMVYWAVVMEVADAGGKDGWKAVGKDDEESRRRLVERFKGETHERFKVVPELFEKTKEVFYYPVNSLELGGTWWKGRCVILGDAAHAMPPQGHSIGLALEDTVLLARLLSEKPELSLEEVFTRWDNIRRPMISESYKHASRGFNSNKELSWFWNLVREWVTWAIISTFGRYMDHQFTYDISKLEI